MLVPPRKGQRTKSDVLPHFNSGKAFTIVEIYENQSVSSYGILNENVAIKNNKCRVWVEKDLIDTEIDCSKIRVLHLPEPPKHAYSPKTVIIGGLGKHIRWKVVMAKKKHTGNCTLLVSHITNDKLFSQFVENKLRPFAFCNFDYKFGSSGVKYVEIDIPDHKNVTFVAAALHCEGYHAITKEADMASSGFLGIERYDRSEHTWWNQNQKDAGPLRDTHRWKYGFIPSHWKDIPFTWLSLAKNVKNDLSNETELLEIPLPLRNYVCDEMLSSTNDEDTKSKIQTIKTDKRCVTSRLTEEQNRQLLATSYWTYLAPFDDKRVYISFLLAFRYMIHGYISRELGGYSQKANHIGHGAYVREFKSKPQYNIKNLNKTVLNKVMKEEGIRGSGFKGTRGKYGHKDFPKYEPVKKMKRSFEADLSIREVPTNCFQNYADIKRKKM